MRRVSSGGKHPDRRENATLRGVACERRSWSAHLGTRGVSNLSAYLETDDHGVLEQSRRRGTFGHLDLRRRIARRGEVLYSRRFGPRSSLSSFQPIVGATGSGVVTLPASGVMKSDDLWCFILWRACSAKGLGIDGADVARCPLISKGMGYRTPSSSKGARGKRGQTRRTTWLQKGPEFMAGRGSGARGVCSRVVVVYVAEVDRQRRTQRSVRSQLHPIWGAYGDGGLVRGQQAGAKSAARRLRANGR